MTPTYRMEHNLIAEISPCSIVHVGEIQWDELFKQYAITLYRGKYFTAEALGDIKTLVEKLGTPDEELEKRYNGISDTDLVEYYKNTRTTLLQCAGRTKAESNRLLLKGYEAELLRRGISIPDEGDAGLFNGKGSS